ncbi:MAG: aminotransferase class I/II-fold pyridoxal phosphate-dependent enzyme [Clostridiales bacterium]|nr:aminotransferase class I/II-fold pyridoxal phosphate-dependent enzyme [Clostridiales bacterium]
MYLFNSDYLEGAHPLIMQALVDTNFTQTPGYGTDRFCREAAEKILAACQSPNSFVHFLVGGTQANMTVISAFLRPWEGVISADTGHINVHETGAVESTGHKVLALTGKHGKISAAQVDACVTAHAEDSDREHTIKPAMVYISQPTELGTLYSLAELTDISEVCRKHGLLLFVDGARLAYALACPENDVTLKDLARLTDAFYIGGTKCGALFGEAVVIRTPELSRHFRYMIKQKGGMLAKGRLLGIQFGTLFTDGLYEKVGAYGIRMADRIRTALLENGYELFAQSPTNQLFPIFSARQLEALSKEFSFAIWQKLDDGAAVRICTSWATEEKAVDSLIIMLRELK